MADIIIAQLFFLESEDSKKDVYFYINSPGGVVTAGLAIYDTMQYISCDVATICFGQAASMGAVLSSPPEIKTAVVALHPSVPRLLAGYGIGAVLLVDLVGINYGPLVVTAWLRQTPNWTFWRKRDQSIAFRCPLCRTWSEVPASALGTELPCPHCRKRIKLNPFTINADWRAVAEAWRGES